MRSTGRSLYIRRFDKFDKDKLRTGILKHAAFMYSHTKSKCKKWLPTERTIIETLLCQEGMSDITKISDRTKIRDIAQETGTELYWECSKMKAKREREAQVWEIREEQIEWKARDVKKAWDEENKMREQAATQKAHEQALQLIQWNQKQKEKEINCKVERMKQFVQREPQENVTVQDELAERLQLLVSQMGAFCNQFEQKIQLLDHQSGLGRDLTEQQGQIESELQHLSRSSSVSFFSCITSCSCSSCSCSCLNSN